MDLYEFLRLTKFNNIHRIKEFLSEENKETLIHAFITGRLDYCNSLFYVLPNSLVLELQRIQKSCDLLVYSAPKFCLVTPILRNLHWLPVGQRVDLRMILIAFKILNNMAPTYLSSLSCVATPSRYSLRSSCDGILVRFPPMKSSKTLMDRAFMFAAQKLWSRLPRDIRTTVKLCHEIQQN